MTQSYEVVLSVEELHGGVVNPLSTPMTSRRLRKDYSVVDGPGSKQTIVGLTKEEAEEVQRQMRKPK